MCACIEYFYYFAVSWKTTHFILSGTIELLVSIHKFVEKILRYSDLSNHIHAICLCTIKLHHLHELLKLRTHANEKCHFFN